MVKEKQILCQKKTTSVYDNPPNILHAQGHAWWTRPQDTKPHAKSAARKSSSGNQKKWNMFLNTCCHSFTKTASPLLSSAQPICFFVQFGTSLGASPFAWPPQRLQPSSSSTLCTLVFTRAVRTFAAYVAIPRHKAVFCMHNLSVLGVHRQASCIV